MFMAIRVIDSLDKLNRPLQCAKFIITICDLFKIKISLILINGIFLDHEMFEFENYKQRKMF